MMQQLLANKDIHISAQTVHKYMNSELGLRSVTRKARYRYRKGAEAYAVFDNLLERDFSAKRKKREVVHRLHISFFLQTGVNGTTVRS